MEVLRKNIMYTIDKTTQLVKEKAITTDQYGYSMDKLLKNEEHGYIHDIVKEIEKLNTSNS